MLLILNGYKSYKSLAIQDLCKRSKIITLYIPAHLSYILQLLNVGCFTPLKQAYSKEIRVLVLNYISQINKKAFIATFAKVFKKAFLKANILLSFRATGLVPNNLLVVLSKLNVKLRTLTPPLSGEPQWNPKTPTNANEIEAQLTLLRDRIIKHQGSSLTLMIDIVNQLNRGTAMLLYGQTLLAARVLQLEASNKAASERKSRKRKRIQKGGDLSKEQAEDLIA